MVITRQGGGVQQNQHLSILVLWKFTEELRLEGASGGHLVCMPLFKQGHLRQVAQDHIQTASECGQSPTPLGSLWTVLSHSHSSSLSSEETSHVSVHAYWLLTCHWTLKSLALSSYYSPLFSYTDTLRNPKLPLGYTVPILCLSMCAPTRLCAADTSFWAWPFSQFSIHLTAYSSSCYFISFSVRILCKTVSKISLKSWLTISTALPSSTKPIISS